MKHALILAPFAEASAKRLGEKMQVTHENWLEAGRIYDPEELGRRLAAEQVHYLVVEADFVFEETFEAAKGLELVGICRNALNHVDIDAATKHGVLVVNVPGRNSLAVAEHTIGLMLGLARRIPQADAFIKGGAWEDPVGGYRNFRGTELAGKIAGIVGLGAIGRLVAKRLAAMEMRLLAFDPYLDARLASSLGIHLTTLDDLLSRSDYVLVHAPANEATMGLIGEGQLKRMKASAYLINPSAPGVVDEAALIAALQAGRIAGAALDVFEGHPLQENSPLRQMSNVVLTPHIGGATEETVERQSEMIAEDILLVAQGRQPKRLVNPAVLKEHALRAKLKV